MKKLPRVTKKELLTQMSELKDSDMVKRAIVIATKAHEGQKRDSGVLYIEEHIFYATLLLHELFSKEEHLETLTVLALLHDTIEDTKVKIGQIKKEFGDEIADVLLLLSKNEKEEGEAKTPEEKYLLNQNYLAQLSENRSAVIIKMVDRIANTNCIIDDNVLKKPEKYKRYVKEVKNLYIPLAKKYNFTKVVKILESEIDRVEKFFL